MSLDDCMKKYPIIEEHNNLITKYKGVDNTFNVGDIIGKLTIIKLMHFKDDTNTIRKGCICKCECGNYIGPSRLVSLLNGDLLSCGCYQKEVHSKLLSSRNFKHGFSTEHLYTLWGAMINRATDINRKDAKYYSEKGITVCDAWRNDYVSFREWSLKNGYKEGLSLDRIDNSKGYSPENCRWIPKEQNSNKTNNRILTYNGISKTITQWSRERNLSWGTINRRLKVGKTIGQALGYEN